jgi:hypothetical protein
MQQQWCGSLPVGGTSCPLYQWWVEARLLGVWSQQPQRDPPHSQRWEPLPWRELGRRQSPSSGFSSPRVRAHAAAAHTTGPWRLLACPLACSTIAPLLARRRVAKCGLVLVSLSNECAIAEMGGRAPILRSKLCGTPRWSPLSWPTAGTMPPYGLSPWQRHPNRPSGERGSSC